MALTNKLTAIANGFRQSRGITDKLSLSQMAALAAIPLTGGGGGTVPPDDTNYLDLSTASLHNVGATLTVSNGTITASGSNSAYGYIVVNGMREGDVYNLKATPSGDKSSSAKILRVYGNQYNQDNDNDYTSEYKSFYGDWVGYEIDYDFTIAEGDVGLIFYFYGGYSLSNVSLTKKSGSSSGGGTTTDMPGVPTYYRQQVSDVIGYTRFLGEDFKHYIILTDPHYKANQRRSPAIINYLMGTGLYDKRIFLGDYTSNWEDYTDERWQTFVSDFADTEGDTLAITGNHDINIGASRLVSSFMSNAQVTYDTDKSWYYDQQDIKVRFIGIQYDSTSSVNLSWIQNCINSLSSGWRFMLFLHLTLDIDSRWEGSGYKSSVSQNILNAISASGKCIGVVTGHQHMDQTDYVSSVYHTTLNCDRLDSSRYYDYYDYPDRTAGTVSEQAITVMSINTKDGIVRFARIGACNSDHRSWYYSYDEEYCPVYEDGTNTYY